MMLRMAKVAIVLLCNPKLIPGFCQSVWAFESVQCLTINI